MKKIIATVLAMVMALALCTTAFAAPDTYDLYRADSTKVSGGKLVAGVTADISNKPIAVTPATKNSDGTGNLEYLTIDGVEYVKTTSPTISDYAVTAKGKTDILFYVTVAGDVNYVASGKAFTNFGPSCGQIVAEVNAKYYEVTSGDDEGKVGKASDNGTVALLVDGKIVKVETPVAVKVHTWVVTASKVEDNAIVPTQVSCACGAKSSAIYKVNKAPAGSKVEPITGNDDYVVVPNGTTTPSTDKNTSPKTFDAGIAMYVGMALTSVAGSAVVIGKKKEF